MAWLWRKKKQSVNLSTPALSPGRTKNRLSGEIHRGGNFAVQVRSLEVRLSVRLPLPPPPRRGRPEQRGPSAAGSAKLARGRTGARRPGAPTPALCRPGVLHQRPRPSALLQRTNVGVWALLLGGFSAAAATGGGAAAARGARRASWLRCAPPTCRFSGARVLLIGPRCAPFGANVPSFWRARASDWAVLRAANVQSFWRERDNVGVQDSVLLEDYENESVFLDNLEKRFKKDLIYVSRRPDWCRGGARAARRTPRMLGSHPCPTRCRLLRRPAPSALVLLLCSARALPYHSGWPPAQRPLCMGPRGYPTRTAPVPRLLPLPRTELTAC